MAVVVELEQFVIGELTQGSGIETIDPEENLLANGIIDSHGLMELVSFIETRYGVKLADEDLTPENFESLATVGALVSARRTG
ncbi:MAG: acyl carrier protein [Solirubrobacterales bacterium]|nr:acyl carrier protein [Solirubrobacterales bacterium]